MEKLKFSMPLYLYILEVITMEKNIRIIKTVGELGVSASHLHYMTKQYSIKLIKQDNNIKLELQFKDNIITFRLQLNKYYRWDLDYPFSNITEDNYIYNQEIQEMDIDIDTTPIITYTNEFNNIVAIHTKLNEIYIHAIENKGYTKILREGVVSLKTEK
jgi:hypothetical protein